MIHHTLVPFCRRLPIVLTSLLIVSFFAQVGEAEEEIKHGMEFTFTNPRLIRYGNKRGFDQNASPENIAAREQWADKMQLICHYRPANHPEKCKVEKGKRRGSPFYRIIYPDGWWYAVTVDPLVIEVVGKPVTLAEAVRMRDRMQRDIFKHAEENVRTTSLKRPKENAGLTPHSEVGGGHIHFDLKTSFQNDALLFRNFLVDFNNHPTLAVGGLGNSPLNGPPLALLTEEQQLAFAEVIRQFDHSRPQMSIKELAQMITEKVYYATLGKPSFFRKWAWKPADKYQAVNLTRVVNPDLDDSERTIEIRSLRPQKSADDFIKLITLFDSRIKALKKYNRPIPFIKQTISQSVLRKDPQRVVDEFSAYVTTSGLKFDDYKDLLPGELQEKISTGKVVCKPKNSSSGGVLHKDIGFKRIYDRLAEIR